MKKIISLFIIVLFIGCRNHSSKDFEIRDYVGQLETIEPVNSNFTEHRRSMVKTTKCYFIVEGDVSAAINDSCFVIRFKKSLIKPRQLILDIKHAHRYYFIE